MISAAFSTNHSKFWLSLVGLSLVHDKLEVREYMYFPFFLQRGKKPKKKEKK